MPLYMYPKCWRGRSDCQPIHCIEATSDDVTDEQIENLDFEPLSFVCCGVNSPENRQYPQDCYRFCFKNEVIDEMSDNDVQDLAHTINVMSAALSHHATLKVNEGAVLVPTEQEEK